MSMEMYVGSERSLNSIHAWQIAINVTEPAVKLSTAVSFAELHGALPVQIGSVVSHFECDHWDVEDIFRTYPNIHFDRRWKRALAFRWGGDVDSAFSAYVAAAAYARAVDGAIFDCQEGAVISPERAIAIANELKQNKIVIEAAAQAAARKVIERMKKRRLD